MKNALLSLAVATSLLVGPALAQDSGDAIYDVGTLTEDQRDALISILSGLPRQ